MDPKKMKKIGFQMNLLMGFTLSLCLSLLGNLLGGHFTVPGFLISFVISFIISLLIGTFIPHRKASESAVRAVKARPGSIKARLMESLISDCIYTPIITLAMVGLAYFTSRANASPEALEHMPSFFQMFIGSFIACMIVGYILIFIFMPIFMKLVFSANGVPFPPGAPDKQNTDKR
ncbi:MAG: hypothetical protein K5876_08325 [Ruminiclostridium sp.]|nr:hypothetical protein [Ruminiclostridium sp.]